MAGLPQWLVWLAVILKPRIGRALRLRCGPRWSCCVSNARFCGVPCAHVWLHSVSRLKRALRPTWPWIHSSCWCQRRGTLGFGRLSFWIWALRCFSVCTWSSGLCWSHGWSVWFFWRHSWSVVDCVCFSWRSRVPFLVLSSQAVLERANDWAHATVVPLNWAYCSGPHILTLTCAAWSCRSKLAALSAPSSLCLSWAQWAWGAHSVSQSQSRSSSPPISLGFTKFQLKKLLIIPS